MRTLVVLLLAMSVVWPVEAQDSAEAIDDPLPDVIPGPARVIDGDTLEVRGRRIHLFGIEAPAASTSAGRMARAYLEDLIGGRPVRCVPVARDRQSHLVAWCRVDGHPLYGTVHLAHIMVFDGYAAADPANSHANPALARMYRDAEAVARRMKSGLWGQ